MIRLQKLTIEEFRGIRNLELPLDGGNFGICGPNGTGKSGIVDAIEFALTGSITRLAGYGTSGVTIKSHAPHVDSAKHPEKARVLLTVSLVSSGESIVVDRRVSTAGEVALNPCTKQSIATISELAAHPEFALSRREIIKYILTPPGQRSQDVQTLLRLDHIEKVRLAFVRVVNSAKGQARKDTDGYAAARTELLQAFKVGRLDAKVVLAAINERRNILQLPLIEELKADTEFDKGLTPEAEKGKQPPKIQKKSALDDVKDLVVEAGAAGPPHSVEHLDKALAALGALKADPKALRDIKHHILLTHGLNLLEDDACPLCDTSWDIAELRNHLSAKLAKAKEAEQQLKILRPALAVIIQSLIKGEERYARLAGYCNALKPPLDHPNLEFARSNLMAHRTAIEKISADPTDLDAEIALLSSRWWTLPKPAETELETLNTKLMALPEPTKEDEARAYLNVAQDRYGRFISKRKTAATSEAEQKVAEKVLEQYNTSSNAVLGGIYEAVEKDFTAYYRFINHDDEEQFEGKLKPSVGKLGFDVNFYGRGLFPPGAYHSEGHQDGMGLCLYLALMKHTLGDKFTFAVLDDVLMSIDIGHRRDVCRLLKQKFPHTQFVITTHDPVWLQYMKTEQFIQASISFGGWTVEAGPKIWNDIDVWTQIEQDLEKNDVSRAAGALRRYLEYAASLLADQLGAPVQYHGNGQYDLGDLMPSVARTWKDTLAKASKAAASWSNKEQVERLGALEKMVKEKVAASQTDQWIINKALHHNEWVHFQPAEFRTVAQAFKELLDTLKCANCNTFVYVSPSRGPLEVLKCDCGSVNFNLKRK